MPGRKKRPKPVETLDDPRLIKALSHPLRVRVLALLEERKASPVKMADILGVDLGVVSYHVRRLEQFGLIELVDTTQRRGAIEHHYKARERPTISDVAWGAAGPVAKQAYLDSFLQQAFGYATAAASAGGFDHSDAHFTRTVVRLDAKGWARLAKACENLLALVDKLEAESAKRIAADPHAPDVVNAGLVIMMFEAMRLSDGAAGKPDTPASKTRSRVHATSS